MLNLNDIFTRHGLELTATDEEIAKNINDYLVKNLSPYRYEHSLRTLEFALRLALRDRLEKTLVQKLVVAATAHDITKEKPPEFHKNLFKKFHREDLAGLPPALYHSKSAPYVLREEFNIQDEFISHAIMYHSTGCADMPPLSRIIFGADFLASLEPVALNQWLKATLPELCMEKARSTISYLLSEKLPVQPESINFYNVLISETRKGNL
jgi:predicted HD superfamily hydrolase involved in NAD metabolism